MADAAPPCLAIKGSWRAAFSQALKGREEKTYMRRIVKAMTDMANVKDMTYVVDMKVKEQWATFINSVINSSMQGREYRIMSSGDGSKTLWKTCGVTTAARLLRV